MKVDKIISGGQTGVDRAALDVAYQNMIQHSGWCPRNRIAEDGRIPTKYNLQETSSENPSERTELNVRDSDGTIIIVPKTPINVNDGTNLTIDTAKNQNKPHVIVDLSQTSNFDELNQWIEDKNIKTLNIAGPRESQAPHIYNNSFKFLQNFLDFHMTCNNTPTL